MLIYTALFLLIDSKPVIFRVSLYIEKYLKSIGMDTRQLKIIACTGQGC
jgi:hypothetical protein